jgi:hypothetical protein
MDISSDKYTGQRDGHNEDNSPFLQFCEKEF